LGAGSYATWTATATNTTTTTHEPNTPTIPAVNLDSLYSAKANEETTFDSTRRLAVPPARSLSGRISWYGPGFHGRRTASGERFDRNEMTAAHKSLPFGTLVRVTDLATGRSVLVRVNDRGPYAHGRILDLSEKAAHRLGIKGRGTASTRAEVYTLPRTDGRLTFDLAGAAYDLHGFGINVMETSSYDEAVALQHRLVDEGREDVYLTQSRVDGKISYAVTVGLFATESLCSTLLAEINATYPESRVWSYATDGNTTVASVTATTPGKTDL